MNEYVEARKEGNGFGSIFDIKEARPAVPFLVESHIYSRHALFIAIAHIHDLYVIDGSIYRPTVPRMLVRIYERYTDFIGLLKLVLKLLTPYLVTV